MGAKTEGDVEGGVGGERVRRNLPKSEDGAARTQGRSMPNLAVNGRDLSEMWRREEDGGRNRGTGDGQSCSLDGNQLPLAEADQTVRKGARVLGAQEPGGLSGGCEEGREHRTGYSPIRASSNGVDAMPEDIAEYMTIVFGDLGTYERILSALRRRSIEKTPYNRLQSVAFGIGYFHFKMAGADTLWRLLVSPGSARQDETSFMKIAGRLRPNDSSRLASSATFRQQHELINHVGILMRLDAWRAEVQRRKPQLKSLEAWADTKPSLAEIGEIADCLVRDYVEGEGLNLYEFAMRPATICDEVRENAMRTHHYLLLYEEVSYTMNAGDIGRLEALLAQWIPLFRAAGKHKYGNYTLRFMHDLYEVYPESYLWRRGDGSNYTKERILLESVLVQIFRNSHANMEHNFALPGLTTRHARKDMKATFIEVLKHLEEGGPNVYRAGCKSNYVIPDVIVKGAAVIEKNVGIRGDGGDTRGSSETSTAQGGREAQEGDLQSLEVSADDLSVEASL
ncbi:hypothetical protein LXA43DRAFT_1067709 [Ganoderma leucocontextum]|nr:hypothetical protein LXA43DRAFT_1067709 [Ganoderma leucocontextum]